MSRVATLRAITAMASALLLAPSLYSQKSDASLLAFVTDSTGHPASGARIQVRRYGLHSKPVLSTTAADGTVSLAGLSPGLYFIDVGTGDQFAARRAITLAAQEHALLTITLPALVSSARLTSREHSPEVQDEEFRWVLRSASNSRPVLRVLDGDSTEPVRTAFAGNVALTAGNGGQAFDSAADVTTSFNFETPLWGDAALGFSGNTGVNLSGNSQLQATFAPHSGDHARIIASVRELDSPRAQNLPAIHLLSLNFADSADIGDNLHLQYGALVTGVSWISSPYTVGPYARLEYRLGPSSRLEYRFAEAGPPLHFEDGYAEAPLSAPHITMTGFRPLLERTLHNEISYVDELTPVDLVSLSAYTDRFSGAEVLGALAPGELIATGNVLPDLFNQTFTTNGGNYSGRGVRAVYTHRLSSDVSASVAFTTGTVLTTAGAIYNSASPAAFFVPVNQSAVTLKLAGQVPSTHTHLICSYRRLNRPAATVLDPYDDSAAQSDSYLNVFVRQPLPRLPLVASRMEALAEMHNLLAQGYIPVLMSDGQSFYLLQSARAFRGGVSFSF